MEEGRVDAACAITPRIAAPTVMPLHRSGWVVVRAIVERRRAYRMIDRLKVLEAVGIVLADMLFLSDLRVGLCQLSGLG
ncbi:MAG TPA: hypothetical protein EYQ18_18580 [Candidatus Handelsmanbacteria bacterium]|nr:hypothetical protein [Candidatus Handelsmanbacteria bacterium]